MIEYDKLTDHQMEQSPHSDPKAILQELRTIKFRPYLLNGEISHQVTVF